VRLHWLGHVPFEDAANIGVWAEKRGHTVTATKLYAAEPLPEVGAIDALAIMGGPMNVHQYGRYPWLRAEKRFIEQAIRIKIPVLGVCLGAQLIADVLGAKVAENPQVEIGWFPVHSTAAARESDVSDGLPTEFMAFHWHGDTFEIPAGGQHLAESEACANQAFAYGRSVLGLQFHLEYSQESILRMLTHCAHELIDAPFVQDREEIVAGAVNLAPAKERLFALLDNWLR